MIAQLRDRLRNGLSHLGFTKRTFDIHNSADIKEELKRKIRISAGGLQAIWRLRALLNPFKYGILTFQYVSHRVLRWTLAPIALPIIFIINIYLAKTSAFYTFTFGCQMIFYTLSALGWACEQFKLKIKMFYIPYYFCMMNLFF